jgi:hypothetical protein
VARLRIDHRQQQQLQVVRAEFSAARETVAVAAEAARAAAEASATATATAARVVMAADRVPQCVGKEAVVVAVPAVMTVAVVLAVMAVLTPVSVCVAAATAAEDVVVEFASATVIVFPAPARLVAEELAVLAAAWPVGVGPMRVAASAVTALEVGAAALAAMRLQAGERVPERLERRMVLACREVSVRAARTGKPVWMSHSRLSREYLKMCLKIYI